MTKTIFTLEKYLQILHSNKGLILNIYSELIRLNIMNNKQLMKEFLFYNYDRHWTDSKGETLDFQKMFEGYASLLNYDMSDGKEALSNLILQKKIDS